MNQGPRRGLALIVVLTVLALLLLLSVSFSTISALENHVSKAYSDEVLARLVAKAGMEQGFARLRELIEMELAGRTTGTISPLQALRYYGSDLAEKGDNPALLNTPLELALNPSLAVEAGGGGGLEQPQNPLDENTRPAKVIIDGKTYGFSGYLSSARYGLRSDIFSLRITDMSGMIYVNDGVGENPRYGSVSANLKRILNQLGKVIKVTGLGDKIVDRRPPKGYADKPALEAVLGHADYVTASPFLTAHAWVDHSVIQPVPLSNNSQVLQAYRDALGFSNDASNGPYYRGRPAVFRYGRGRNRDGTLVGGALRFSPEAADPQGLDHAIWGVDELNPQWIEVCARAPVNLNAAPREVLITLLTDLQGFWMAGRRMNNPNCSDPATNTRLWNNSIVQSLDSGVAGQSGGDGDAMGFLYSTDKITWSPGNTGDSVNSAAAIADELIACREGLVSKVTQFDYNKKKNPEAWFAGQFRTWRQFYAFCDHLVKVGLIRESRGIYFYHPPPGSGYAGGGQPAPVGTTDALMAMASQAIADVIKANFNPNCHLNETNPDENMALLVDKTDLIVMSTEGAFLPGGYFEIESLGRVLRPAHLESKETRTHAINDAMSSRDNTMVAEAALTGIVKLYDARRFTSQKDFYPGEITKRQTLPETNNGLSVEIGPEPDCGKAPREAEWDGYLALPTNGGQPWASSPGGPEIPLPKPPDVLGFTPKSDVSEIEPTTNTLHAHFTYDTRLHTQADGIPANLAPVSMTNENVENRPDRTEQLAGPYDPSMGVDPGSGRGGNRHRLARSFRLPDGDSTARPPDTFAEAAPLDLRIDGAYLERDANLAYWMTPDSLGGHKFMIKFVTSFWMKPNFHPETTGKPRLLWNGGRAELRKNLWNFYSYPVEPGMLDLYLTASQDPGTESTFFTGSFTNWSPCRPASLLFMHSASYMTDPLNFPTSLCYALSVATQTKTLNHHYHDPDKGWSNQHPPSVIERGTPGYERDNPLAAHRWMHVVVACKTNWASPTPDARIWVNGKSTVQMPNSPRWGVYPLGLPTSYRIDWTQNFADDNTFNEFPYADKNLMKFGQTHRVTTIVHADNAPYVTRHNFSCDSTIDEFSHFAGWDEISEGAALAQWRRGRYHSPRMKDEGRYTSEPFSLLTQSSRRLPPASGGGSTGTTTRAEQAALQPIQVLGVAWTVFGETLNREHPELAPQMIDYNTVDSPEPDLLTVKTELSLEADQIWSAPVTRDAFSMIEDAQTGQRLVLKDATKVRFRVRFAWDKPAPVTTILHATPYVDDVTIYFDAGDSGFISFQTK